MSICGNYRELLRAGLFSRSDFTCLPHFFKLAVRMADDYFCGRAVLSSRSHLYLLRKYDFCYRFPYSFCTAFPYFLFIELVASRNYLRR